MIKVCLRLSLLISALTIIVIVAPAQEFAWANAYSATSAAGSSATSVAVGNNDNVFVCGRFEGELNVGGIKLESNTTAGYVAKLDSSGNTLWARTLGAASYSTLFEIAIDTVGHIYAIGNLRGTLNIENDTIACEATFCSVLVKYNGEGDLLWYKHFPARLSDRLKTDDNGNAYVMGRKFSEDPNVNAGTWIAKFGRNGEQIFYQDITKPSNSGFFSGLRISIDPEENVYVSGHAGKQALIGDISYSNTTSGFVLVKCTFAGVPSWVRLVERMSFGESIWPAGTIENDRFGNTYYFIHHDMLSLVKYDPEGNILWAKRDEKIFIGIAGISIDVEGNLLTTGAFRGDFRLGQARFDGSRGLTVFIAKFNANGECLWALHGSDQLNEMAYSLARSRQTGALFVGGVLGDPAPKFGEIELSASTSQDRAFVLKVNGDSNPVQVDSVQVNQCFEGLMIPNVITPNSDAYNDYFVIEALDLTKANTLLIFNRSGKKVYSNSSYRNNWNGSDLPPGTYFYELVNGDDGKSCKGWIQIIR